jgi:predicted RNase H-like nuclease (RuvC/YqgF family)
MNDALMLLIGTIIGGVLSSILGPVITARFSKSRQQKDAELARDYLSLVDMSADQLERRINLITKLDERIGELEKKNREQERETERLTTEREERDHRIESLEESNEALQAGIAALKKQIEVDTLVTERLREEVQALRKQVAEGEIKYKALKDYTVQLIAAWRDGKEPPEMPRELSDSITGWKWNK